MILNFFQILKEWFTILFEKISWTNVLTFITGIVFGIILSGLVYLILLMISIKKQEKTIHAKFHHNIDPITYEIYQQCKKINWEYVSDIWMLVREYYHY